MAVHCSHWLLRITQSNLRAITSRSIPSSFIQHHSWQFHSFIQHHAQARRWICHEEKAQYLTLLQKLLENQSVHIQKLLVNGRGSYLAKYVLRISCFQTDRVAQQESKHFLMDSVDPPNPLEGVSLASVNQVPCTHQRPKNMKSKKIASSDLHPSGRGIMGH